MRESTDQYRWKCPSIGVIHDTIREFFPDENEPLPRNPIVLADLLLAIKDAQSTDTLKQLGEEKKGYSDDLFDAAGHAKIKEVGKARWEELKSNDQ